MSVYYFKYFHLGRMAITSVKKIIKPDHENFRLNSQNFMAQPNKPWQ